MSTSVRLVTCALQEFASTMQVPTLARTAGLGLDHLLMDWDAKVWNRLIYTQLYFTTNTDRWWWFLCPVVVTLLFLLPDVDECAQGDLCLGGVCANTEGSYTCTRCKAGYRVSQDRQRCEGKFQPTKALLRLSKTYSTHLCSLPTHH